MTCAWKELLAILPGWLADAVDRRGRENLQELRLRLGGLAEMVPGGDLDRPVTREDLNFCINTASRYSPWAARTIGEGFITAPGGHRIGICGEAAVKDGGVIIRDVTSVCIRVARDFPGISRGTEKLSGSILLLGPPGSGKTTLLRDLMRRISESQTTAVVDERGEIFPPGFRTGRHMDVLRGCPKAKGIDMVLRTMGPEVIAVDEITAEEDCDSLIRAGWCGVRLVATAHAATVRDLQCRRVYRTLAEAKLFDHILVLSRDKSWRVERMDL